MSELTPFVPQRPLMWSDFILDLQEMLKNLNVSLFIVGGAVRDAYLHHPIHDIDLVTPGDAVAIARKIANHLKADVFVLDQERGVARVIINDLQEGQMMIDFARFRADTLLEDLIDRDFTINAIAVDINGSLNEVIDPLNGIKDLSDKVLRRCSSDSLVHDPVRALRAIRMSTQFHLRIEPETLKDIRNTAKSLSQSSVERLRDELFKILSLARPATALRVADTLGLLEVLLPEIKPLHEFSQLQGDLISDAWLHTLTVVERLHAMLVTISPMRTDSASSTFELGMLVIALDRYRKQLQNHIMTALPNERNQWSLLLLAAILHDSGYPQSTSPDMRDVSPSQISAQLAEERCVELRLSSHEKQIISDMILHHRLIVTMPDEPSDLDLHRYWYALGTTGIDIILLGLSDYLGTVGTGLDQNLWIKLLEKARLLIHAYFDRYNEIVFPTPLLDGNQLMASLNLQPGPQIGRLLNLIREGQVMKDINTVEQALEAARYAVNGNGE